jgi:hypothetical protein
MRRSARRRTSDDPQGINHLKHELGLGRLHMDDWYGFNAARSVPVRGTTDPEGITFDGLPGNRLEVGGVGTTELGSLSVTTAKIASQAVGTTELAPTSVNTSKIAAQAVGTSEIAPGSVNTTKIALQAVGTTEINGLAVTTVKIEDLAVTEAKLGPQSVTGGKVSDNLKGTAQSVYGLRTIGNLLGGDALTAAAGNHSHGSGNTHDFDYLPDTHISRILLARQRVRANIRNLDTLTNAQFRLYIRELAIVSLCALALEVDAPDLTAEERRQKRLSGEQIEDFFEWRRSAELEASGEEGVLHAHDLPRYMGGQTDVGEVPE